MHKVIVNYKGRLGNLLFQFAIGWVVSQTADVTLCARPIPGFPGTRGFDGNREASQPLYTRGHPLDLDGCVQHLHSSGDVVLNGYHQRYEILRRMKQPLKAMLSVLDGPQPEQLPGSDDLVVHVRLGDYFSPRVAARYAYPLEEVARVARSQQYGKLYVVTDEANHPFIQRLQSELNAIVVQRSALADFAFLLAAKRLVITPSSYSWWAAWLSNAQTIFFPLEKGVWLRKNNVNLWVDDEARYVPY